MAYDYDEIRTKVRDLVSNRQTADDVTQDVWLALSGKTPAPERTLRNCIIKRAALSVLRSMPGGKRASRATNAVSIEAAELDPATRKSDAGTLLAVAAILDEMQTDAPELFRLASLPVDIRGQNAAEPNAYNKRKAARTTLALRYRVKFADMEALLA